MMTLFLVLGFAGVLLAGLSLLFGDLLDGLGVPALDSDFFSTAAMAAFFGSFGFVGAGVQQATGLGLVSVLAGLAAGIVLAWLAVQMSRFLRRGERSESWNENNIIGTDATVVTAIPAGGFGEVKLNIRGQVSKLNARAEVPIEAGTKVWVCGVASATAVEVSPN